METLYLDTHAVIWLYANKKNLFSKKSIALLNENNLFISPLVELELQYLFEVKRIKAKPKEITDDLYQKINLKKCDYDFHAIILKSLTITWTRDLFDRIIVAQASIGDHKLLTKDKNILKHYKHAVW